MPSITPIATTAANPATTRGTGVHLSYDARTDRIAYTCGKSVFLRSVEHPSQCKQYTGHKYTTTVATFSPSGYYVASGDESGLVRVWDCATDEMILKGEFAILSGRINAIAWDADSKRIIAVGDGRERYGHCFTFDTGNSVGEISGHTAQVNAAAIGPCRPYRAATVSDDAGLVFLTGPPFKFSRSVRGKHTNFVRDVKFSPTGDFIVTAGADRAIALYEGKTGEFIKLIPHAHDGGIFALDWYDNDTFVTCSADATVKRWSASAAVKGEGELKPLNVWKLSAKTIQNQILGVVRTKEFVIAVNLAGDLFYFNEESESPVKTIYGHQKAITALAVEPDSVITGSYDGRILSWSGKKIGTLVDGKPHTNLVAGIATAGSDKLFSAGWDDKIKQINVSGWQIEDLASLPEQPVQLASDGESTAAVITSSSLLLYKKDGSLNSIKLDYEPSSVAISKSYVAVTDSRTFKISLYDKSLHPVSVTFSPLRARPSFSSFSHDEKYLAVGEANGKIFCYEVSTGKLVTSRWAFNNSRITGISWNADNDHVIAGSLDTNLIVYSVSEPSRNIQLHNTHKEGVSGVSWISQTEAVSVGADACVKYWKVELN